MNATKKEFLELWSRRPELTMHAAARLSGASLPTIWRLRQEDAHFNAAVEQLQEQVYHVRRSMVEDASMSRAMDETTGADTLRIFLLQNWWPNRYKDMRSLRLSGEQDAPPIRTESTVEQAIQIGDQLVKF